MTYTWKDVGDRPDKKLSKSEKEAIATEWNRYEKEERQSRVRKIKSSTR